jgi:hypothetical protein
MKKIIFILCLFSALTSHGQTKKIRKVVWHNTELQQVVSSANLLRFIDFKKNDYNELELKPDTSFLATRSLLYDNWYSTVFLGHKYLFEKQFGAFPTGVLIKKLDSLGCQDCDFSWYEGRIYSDHVDIKVTRSYPGKTGDRIFQKTENRPGFFGGTAAFQQLVQGRLQCTDYKAYIQEDSAFFFTVLIKRDSMVHEVRQIDSLHSPLRQLIKDALIKTYGWKSAFQGGRNVNGYLQVFIYIRKDGSIVADYYR